VGDILPQHPETGLPGAYFAENAAMAFIPQSHYRGAGVPNRDRLKGQNVPDIAKSIFAPEHALKLGIVKVDQHLDYRRNARRVS
jgi:hypothetical protein